MTPAHSGTSGGVGSGTDIEVPGGEEPGSGRGLTLASAALLFLLLRLFAVSDYDWHTAFAVLHTIDLGDSMGIVVSTLMANSLAACVFLALLLPVSVLRVTDGMRGTVAARRRQAARGSRGRDTVPPAELRRERPDLTAAVLLAITLVAVITYVRSFDAWWLPVLACAVAALLFALAYGARAGARPRQAALWASHHLGALIVLGMLLGAATLSTPWVPLERIGVRGEQPVRGYVLEAEPGFVKLLTAENRHFRIVPDVRVTSRVELGGH
ncbi:hypothetical protein DSC45_23155 [Streptomyces sp. YIM 130001]|uniref:hypothetical protein n=1 Tax=Streptomyces sp. YIM 130001 TaxID=2259644 RepID=UPI000EBECAD9|nr:hypothetical protein [Streptomyces sp. YIM 130001]RII13857.1 hypothetical protein DSC45_23155 [Streptomyces sp. YIM 130001]